MSEAFPIHCSHCAVSFDALEASWCSCIASTRSLVCPHCLRCFCKASHHYKQSFWGSAPESLWAVRMAMHAGAAHLKTSPSAGRNALPRPLVLVVEDDPKIQRLTAEAIGELGYGYLGANDGQEGLELARQFVPDLILTDALMPRLDGREMCRLLKADMTTAHIRCVIMTGLYTRNRYRTEALSSFHADDYVHKPIDFDQLRLLLEKHVG